MKRTIYLLALLFCFAGCEKQEVTEKMAVTRVIFANKAVAVSPSIHYNGKKYDSFVQVPSAYGNNKVEIYDNITGKRVIDTTLNITGAQTYYIYQPFDIVDPVIVSALPTVPPVDPRNPLKNEAAAREGYVKMKISFNTTFILPNQTVDMIVLSATAASPATPVVIETLHGIKVEYNTTMFEVKRPVLADGSLSQSFTFGLIDPATGTPLLNGGGTTFSSGIITLPITEKNLYMFYMQDATNSRGPAISVPVDGKYYILRSTILWSL